MAALPAGFGQTKNLPLPTAHLRKPDFLQICLPFFQAVTLAPCRCQGSPHNPMKGTWTVGFPQLPSGITNSTYTDQLAAGPGQCFDSLILAGLHCRNCLGTWSLACRKVCASWSSLILLQVMVKSGGPFKQFGGGGKWQWTEATGLQPCLKSHGLLENCSKRSLKIFGEEIIPNYCQNTEEIANVRGLALGEQDSTTFMWSETVSFKGSEKWCQNGIKS